MSNSEMISYIVGIGGLMLAFLGWMRNSKGDTSDAGEWRGAVSTKLDAIMDQLKGLIGIPERVKALEEWRKQHTDEHGR